MFAISLLTFVLILLVGIVLVETLNPMPKATKAWGKAVSAAPVVPVVMVDDWSVIVAARHAEWAAEQAYWLKRQAEWDEIDARATADKEARRAVEASWADYESAGNTVCDTTDEPSAASNYGEWMDAFNERLNEIEEQKGLIEDYYAERELDAQCGIDWADDVAEEYLSEQASKTRRQQAKHAKFANRPFAKPYTCKLVQQSSRFVDERVTDSVYDYHYERTEVFTTTVDTIVCERTDVPDARTHNTKHANPLKGNMRMSEVVLRGDEAQEQRDLYEEFVEAVVHSFVH